MSEDLTLLLNKVTRGHKESEAMLYNSLYGELKNLANMKMFNERSNHTLGATALVNEAYMKLFRVSQIDWQNRKHFLCMASKVMRQILVDHARAKHSQKRGDGQEVVSFDEEFHFQDTEQVLEVNEVLEELKKLDERKAQVVEMKFFAGLTNSEIAKCLEVSEPTVKREWAFCKSWLATRISQ